MEVWVRGEEALPAVWIEHGAPVGLPHMRLWALLPGGGGLSFCCILLPPAGPGGAAYVIGGFPLITWDGAPLQCGLGASVTPVQLLVGSWKTPAPPVACLLSFLAVRTRWMRLFIEETHPQI